MGVVDSDIRFAIRGQSHGLNLHSCASCGKSIHGLLFFLSFVCFFTVCFLGGWLNHFKIFSEEISALQQFYHPSCFTCVTCKTQLKSQYFIHDGKTYCEVLYHHFLVIMAKPKEEITIIQPK